MRGCKCETVYLEESVRDRRHRPMTHAPHNDSYGPQLYFPAGCSGEVAAWWSNSYYGSDQKTALDEYVLD